MPSVSLQQRIQAFENLAAGSPRQNGAYHPPDSPSILEEPISPHASSFTTIVPFTPPHSLPGSPSSSSPPDLGRKTSLIDMKDWVVADGPSPQPSRQNGKHTNGWPTTSDNSPRRSRAWNGLASTNSSPPLINLESPPKPKSVKAPPLPPRKPSYPSLKTVNHNALRPPVRSDSLTVEQHTYPPLSDGSRIGPGHAPASSVSSFHSVSLSSDGGMMDNDGPVDKTHISTFPMDRHNSGESGDTNSLDESFENVSSACAVSPTTASALAFNWGEAMNKAKQLSPPKLPQRPSSKSPSPGAGSTPLPRSVPASPQLASRSISLSSSSSTTTTTPATRRVPPPPPPSISHAYPRFTPRSSRASLASTSASDRSSILSNATTTSRTSTSTRASTQVTSKLSRPTPVPAAAKKRYEAVFVSNIIHRRNAEKIAAKKKAAMLAPPGTRKSRAAAGWRGLSVDLITNPDDHPVLSGKEKEDAKEDKELDIEVGPEERMDAFTVQLIWSASKLEKEKLKTIWSVVCYGSILPYLFQLKERMRRRRSRFSRPRCICERDVAHRRGTPSSTVHSTNQSDPPTASNETCKPSTHSAIAFGVVIHDMLHILLIVALHCTFDVRLLLIAHWTLFIALGRVFDVTLVFLFFVFVLIISYHTCISSHTLRHSH